MLTHKSRWHRFNHLIRKSRRQALAGCPMAYGIYMQLMDNRHKFIPERNPCPQGRSLSKVQGYLIMRDMGWRQLRA